jgi:hypothetical protein
MNTIEVCIETGKKKTFASAAAWPGWSRPGRDEVQAMQTLFDYRARYARVITGSGLGFQAPEDFSQLVTIERQPGNTTTDFGAPAVIPGIDHQTFDQDTFNFSKKLLEACWQAFEQAVASAAGRELRRGPRGGGRDIPKIIKHVLEADQGYLRRIAWKLEIDKDLPAADQLTATRQEIMQALDSATREPLPEKGPRGGIIWPARYFVRRTAWHVLDHAWEIEDRILKPG